MIPGEDKVEVTVDEANPAVNDLVLLEPCPGMSAGEDDRRPSSLLSGPTDVAIHVSLPAPSECPPGSTASQARGISRTPRTTARDVSRSPAPPTFRNAGKHSPHSGYGSNGPGVAAEGSIARECSPVSLAKPSPPRRAPSAQGRIGGAGLASKGSSVKTPSRVDAGHPRVVPPRGSGQRQRSPVMGIPLQQRGQARGSPSAQAPSLTPRLAVRAPAGGTLPAASNRSGGASCEPTPPPRHRGGSPSRTSDSEENPACLPGSKLDKLKASANGASVAPASATIAEYPADEAAELVVAANAVTFMEQAGTGTLPPADLEAAIGPTTQMSDQHQQRAQERLNGILAELGSLRDEISECRTEYGLAKDRAHGLEAENGGLRRRLREAEQRAVDFQGRVKELEGERESWKQLWEQMQFQLEECRKKHDGIAERWRQAHEQMRVAKKDRDVDRQRLRQAEQILEELGRPLPESVTQDAVPTGATSPPRPCTGGSGTRAPSVSSNNAYVGSSSPRMGSLPSNSVVTRSPLCELFGDPGSSNTSAPAAGWIDVEPAGSWQRASVLAAPTVLTRRPSLEQQPGHTVVQSPATWTPAVPVVPSLGCLPLPVESTAQLAGVKQQAFDPGRGSLPSTSCMARCSVPGTLWGAQDAMDNVFTL